MKEFIDREEFLKRIKPYDTSDKKDKALYNFALSEMMGTPNANAISIPEGATNGEMLKSMFPNVEIEGIWGLEGLQCVAVSIGLGTSYFALDWWNAPYKRGSEKEWEL